MRVLFSVAFLRREKQKRTELVFAQYMDCVPSLDAMDESLR